MISLTFSQAYLGIEKGAFNISPSILIDFVAVIFEESTIARNKVQVRNVLGSSTKHPEVS